MDIPVLVMHYLLDKSNSQVEIYLRTTSTTDHPLLPELNVTKGKVHQPVLWLGTLLIMDSLNIQEEIRLEDNDCIKQMLELGLGKKRWIADSVVGHAQPITSVC